MTTSENWLSEDKNIAVAQLMSIIKNVNDRVAINQCFSLDQERNIPKKMAKFTYEKHHAGTVGDSHATFCKINGAEI